MLEGHTTLGHLAVHTSTIRLGLLVSGVTWRHPGLLTRIVTTLDVISGGRRSSASAWSRPSASASRMLDPRANDPFEGSTTGRLVARYAKAGVGAQA
ncbi:LLM class flavin-dependent oxidoreductase [Streptomyces sviceus]|uniref:LLM class flavin-dependent oxidoreductase n=1 Tax=Streptomyces sviceus TaxID=285530 RepID=UPI0036CBE50A